MWEPFGFQELPTGLLLWLLLYADSACIFLAVIEEFLLVSYLFSYKVIEILAGGGCALVEWRLETGRTHQIRAHAKYLGVPLLGDDVYGGTKSMALSLLQSRNPSSYHGLLLQLVTRLERPCLHALSLGFQHPNTGEDLSFSQLPPLDFAEILDGLRSIGTNKVT
ncbi:hypothetical protein BUALT_Bualt08G0090900 [Buddleja alternifolia]|uniref:RNA pseudouridine synthase n=1 Tax=Buddleja alternifolia TaxID=168488 RepID=A0AAV6XDB0_9LAMI|nr:hypothetical protein BUALT_Bualt08G0090900 [Buddleja alternifolia]